MELLTPKEEEINGFSALSGPVTVAGEGTTANNGFPKYVITFDAADGDVEGVPQRVDALRGVRTAHVIVLINVQATERAVGKAAKA